VICQAGGFFVVAPDRRPVVLTRWLRSTTQWPCGWTSNISLTGAIGCGWGSRTSAPTWNGPLGCGPEAQRRVGEYLGPVAGSYYAELVIPRPERIREGGRVEIRTEDEGRRSTRRRRSASSTREGSLQSS